MQKTSMQVPQSIGVIGAGQMGLGIAQLCLECRLSVVLHDVAPILLDRARREIKERLWRSKTRPEDLSPEEALKNLVLSDSLRDLHTCNFVIEAIFESYEAKEGLFERLKEYTTSGAILVTNTSSLSVARLARHAPNPSRFLGFHFMNPASRIPLIELIRAPETEDAVFHQCQDFAHFLGKTFIVSHDAPAFVLNRVLIPMMNEAMHVLEERIAIAEDIDTALTLGAQHPIGPLHLADFIGLDVVLAILKTLHTERGEKYRPSALLIEYVEKGWLGRKSGRGFFIYEERGSF
ncbi:MAG: 3-hydroxybutyryl-CoA dehydrogenase [Holosporales bacterium]|jgi:3-hydroxybutyryl-CoA dehydrogenase|nr:3-hydroxybutyryl-CoA dehydrogenase [Holosporales bacterium]